MPYQTRFAKMQTVWIFNVRFSWSFVPSCQIFKYSRQIQLRQSYLSSEF